MQKIAAIMIGLGMLGLSPDNQHPLPLVPGCLFHQQHQLAKRGLLNPRPEATRAAQSLSLPLTVHWPDAVQEDYAREILTYAEASWDREFLGMKFMLPHSDGTLGGDTNLDIYITTDLDPGIGGYAGFSGFVEDTTRQDAYGYLVINNNIDVRIRRFVVAHEMFHLSQMAYDWWEDMSFMEASATWIADHVFDDENIYWRYFPFFNQEPYTALDYISLRSPYQYGAGLFTTFLDEKYGHSDGDFIRKIWESSVQDDIDNEPDFLDSISALLPPGTTMASAYAEFGVWRLLTGSRSKHGFFKEGALWDERMDPWLELNAGVTNLPAKTKVQKAVGPFAHAFLRLENDAKFAGTIEGRVEGVDGVFNLEHLAITETGVRRTQLGTINGSSAMEIRFSSKEDDLEHFVIITNITDGTYDADTSAWTGSNFFYEFRAL